MKNIRKTLEVRRRPVRLADWSPRATPGCKDKDEAAKRMAANLERIDALQYALYAEGRRSLLIVLQGMDTSGKDGVIRKVMTAFNPSGCKVWPFKQPSAEESAHDFLWRIHHAAPARGQVAIFNRSHYEDVLVVRVHGLVQPEVWERRYQSINEFEAYLHQHGTRILKFFLHLSEEEQRDRLLARLDDPDKHWKFSEGDLAERQRWPEYKKAYEDALGRCSPRHARWFVIPSDRKWYRDLAISEVLREALEEMDPHPPKVRLDVKKLRRALS